MDGELVREVGYGICPANGMQPAWGLAKYRTKHRGGDRAVAEACFHIKEKFFSPVCPKCAGTGNIAIELTPWKDNIEDCPICGGTGKNV